MVVHKTVETCDDDGNCSENEIQVSEEIDASYRQVYVEVRKDFFVQYFNYACLHRLPKRGLYIGASLRQFPQASARLNTRK